MWISTPFLFYYFYFSPDRVGKVSARGHSRTWIGFLFTADSPALAGQVPSGACWESVVVADIPSPRGPNCGPRDFGEVRGEQRCAAGAGGRPSSPALKAPPRPRPRPWALAGRAPAPPPAPRMPCGSGRRSREAGKLCLCERGDLPPPPPPRRPPPLGSRRRGPRAGLEETSPPLPPPPARRGAPSSSYCAVGSGGTRNGRLPPPPSAASSSPASSSSPGRSRVSAAISSGGDWRFFGRRRLAMSCRGR